MAEPIYKLYMGRLREAWYELSEQEQQALFSRLEQKQKELGVTVPVLCDSSWSSEQWTFFGVEIYPDLDAERKYSQFLTEIHWLRYIESLTVIGTAWAG